MRLFCILRRADRHQFPAFTGLSSDLPAFTPLNCADVRPPTDLQTSVLLHSTTLQGAGGPIYFGIAFQRI